MGRNIKPGITFYRMDSGHITNKKVRLLCSEFDSDGYYIWSSLIDYAYFNWGYYFDLNDKNDLEWFAAEYCRKKITLIREVISGCIRRGLFDKTVADSFGILTSDMMQDAFVYATAERRKKGSVFEMQKNWLLINFEDQIPGNLKIVPGKNPQTETKTRQRLRRDKTETGIISDKGSVVPAEPSPQPIKEKFQKKKFVEPTRQEARIYFISLMGDPKKQKSWPADKCEFEADKFVDHYISNGWVQGKGKKPIVDWKAAMRNWVRNGIDGTFSGTSTAVNGTNGRKNETMHAKSEIKIQLPQVEKEINYRYERFLEGEQTIFNIEGAHYNFLKSKAMISFSDLEKENIKSMAVDYIKTESLSSDENNILKFMKLFGVIEFFKQQVSLNKKTVFHADKKRSAEVAS